MSLYGAGPFVSWVGCGAGRWNGHGAKEIKNSFGKHYK